MDAVFLDFRKAFDCVPHKRLLMKIEKLGISGNLLKWIKDFLTDRQQRVLINGISSEWSEVSSGVPQGSVLGPLLFILYVNDLPSEVSSFCKLFADDAKGSLTLAMGKCLWFSVKINVCQSSLSSPRSYPDLSTLWLWILFSILNASKMYNFG